MARFARAAAVGGAAGIRANGTADVRAIRAAVELPVIGIEKRVMPDGRILITPEFGDAAALVQAGAAAVALDCTTRGAGYGALERLAQIKRELGVPVLADIATVEEARRAAQAGADFVLSTMRGYTADTAHFPDFEPDFIRALVDAVDVPVIAEGRIAAPGEAAAAIEAGAFCVIVGSAITRPHEITRRFAGAIAAARPRGPVIGVDLGGTNTKSGVVTASGELLDSAVDATPAAASQEVLLEHLERIVRRWQDHPVRPRAAGIATGGWIDHTTGAVRYATGNLPSWGGAPIRAWLEQRTGLPVAVENDANALALAEYRFGAGRGADPLVCLTLGTGVGGGCVVGGKVLAGGYGLANALGHITVEPGGLPCTCGRRGCLEVYANAAALAREGSLERPARYLARGAAHVVHVLDPSAIVLAGGVAVEHPELAPLVQQALAGEVMAWGRRQVAVRLTTLGYTAGVQGAAALAL